MSKQNHLGRHIEKHLGCLFSISPILLPGMEERRESRGAWWPLAVALEKAKAVARLPVAMPLLLACLFPSLHPHVQLDLRLPQRRR